MMSFSEALQAIKSGERLRRAGWNGPNQFVFLVQGSSFPQEQARPPLDRFFQPGDIINYHAHIDLRNQQGLIVPWFASQGDLLADDWEVLPL